MFEIGDVVIYAEHGLCRIDDICEKDLFGEKRLYYVIHPLSETSLKISTPVDAKKKKVIRTMDRSEAQKLLEVFGRGDIEWIDDAKQRARTYHNLVQTGEREKIAAVAGALMDKKLNTDQKMYDQDRKILNTVQSLLFREMAMSLGTTVDDVAEQVEEQLLAGVPQ